MGSVWGYEGKRVLVSGGGGAGMGAATVAELTRLGAEVHVVDLKEPSAGVRSFAAVDLRDPDAIKNALAAIGPPIDALFNCAGLAGGKASDLDVMLVNFVGARTLTELTVPKMPRGSAIASISSTAGQQWQANLATWMPLVRSRGFDAAKEWCLEHPEEIAGGYGPSKQALIVWTLDAAVGLAQQGIRLNCTSPGPTDTPMMPDFNQALVTSLPVPLGRHSSPKEQAYPWSSSIAEPLHSLPAPIW